MGIFNANNYNGSYVYYGIREHAMAGVMNGLALHGGIRAYGGTFLVFSDYCRPSIRLAALMNIPVIYVMTHDSIGLGEDGPTHQPVEHLAALRAIPNLKVIRPCDMIETIESWEIALETKSPTILALTRQSLPTFKRESYDKNMVNKGAYVIKNKSDYHASILASGSEVEIAVEASSKLEEKNINLRVISFPSMELFENQDENYKREILGEKPLFAVEAGVINGWEKYINFKIGVWNNLYFPEIFKILSTNIVEPIVPAEIINLLKFKFDIFLLFETILYFFLFFLIMIGIYLSYSRSVIISVFLMFFISLILIKKYRLLLSLISLTLFVGLGTYYFSSEETKYFILDTITFQNSSSLGHLVKWIQGILSINDNPLGSGLGTSGNSLSVDDQISVGGENQFIIIGVQMGLVGLINYVGLIYYSIRNSYKLFNLEKDFKLKYLPFVVCSLKFALIFPLMTSNAEIYTFLSLFGWFLVGLNERRFDKLKLIT